MLIRCRANYDYRPAHTPIIFTSGKYLFKFNLEPTFSPPLKLASTDPRSATGFGSFGGRWWLHKVGEQHRRRQLVAMAANIRVVAAVLARPPLSRFEAAERRSSGLDGIDGQCLRRMILPSSNGSCSRLPDSIRTLGGCVRTYATRRTRSYAAEVVAWPL